MWRALSIIQICIKYDLGRFLIGMPWRLRFLPLKVFTLMLRLLGFIFGKQLAKEESLRLALEAGGPIFIKFGQILSTRTDLVPAPLVIQLSYLQDRVTPCPTEQIEDILINSLGGEISEYFSSFEKESAASASVAQVHFGTLKKENKEVAIKVIKPGINEAIERDVKFLYGLARIVTLAYPGLQRLLLTEVVREFEYVLSNELNMQQEGANASQLSRNFSSKQDAALMQVPKIYWSYSSNEVLVMERINGISINNISELRKHKIDLQGLAEKGVKIFFTQVFRDSFFHADMHPGNIFVNISDPVNPIYAGVDFGIMGSLSSDDKKYLALNLLAFFGRDYRRVAELHINCGWVSRDTRVEQLEAAVRGVCEPIFAKPLNEIPFGQVMANLLQTAKRFNMQVQPQLLLLQKTLINVEGLGRQLYPQLNIWETATPILKQWLAEEIGPKKTLRNAKQLYPELITRLPKFVNNLAWAVEDMGQRGHFTTKQEEELIRTRKKLRRTRVWLWLATTTAVGIASVAMLFA